jgi:hypothetical protein
MVGSHAGDDEPNVIGTLRALSSLSKVPDGSTGGAAIAAADGVTESVGSPPHARRYQWLVPRS